MAGRRASRRPRRARAQGHRRATARLRGLGARHRSRTRVASRPGGEQTRGAPVGSMPNWFAKTKEMAAFDRYFRTRDVDEKTLLGRYQQALARMPRTDFYQRADALDTQWRGLANQGI